MSNQLDTTGVAIDVAVAVAVAASGPLARCAG